MRVIRGESSITKGLVTAAEKKRALWIVDRFEMLSKYILGFIPEFVFNVKWKDKGYMFQVADNVGEYDIWPIDICYFAFFSEVKPESVIEGIIHELYHIHLWPYTRFAESSTNDKSNIKEMRRKEEEQVKKLTNGMIRTLKLTEDWDKILDVKRIAK